MLLIFFRADWEVGDGDDITGPIGKHASTSGNWRPNMRRGVQLLVDMDRAFGSLLSAPARRPGCCDLTPRPYPLRLRCPGVRVLQSARARIGADSGNASIENASGHERFRGVNSG